MESSASSLFQGTTFCFSGRPICYGDAHYFRIEDSTGMYSKTVNCHENSPHALHPHTFYLSTHEKMKFAIQSLNDIKHLFTNPVATNFYGNRVVPEWSTVLDSNSTVEVEHSDERLPSSEISHPGPYYYTGTTSADSGTASGNLSDTEHHGALDLSMCPVVPYSHVVQNHSICDSRYTDSVDSEMHIDVIGFNSDSDASESNVVEESVGSTINYTSMGGDFNTNFGDVVVLQPINGHTSTSHSYKSVTVRGKFLNYLKNKRSLSTDDESGGDILSQCSLPFKKRKSSYTE